MTTANRLNNLFPGAADIPASEQLRRVRPVFEALAGRGWLGLLLLLVFLLPMAQRCYLQL